MCRVIRIGGTMDAGGVAEISRWRKPPVTNTKCGESWKAAESVLRHCHRPVRGWDFNIAMNRWFAPPANFQRPVGATHSAVPASNLEMRSVLVGLRLKTSLNRY